MSVLGFLVEGFPDGDDARLRGIVNTCLVKACPIESTIYLERKEDRGCCDLYKDALGRVYANDVMVGVT